MSKINQLQKLFEQIANSNDLETIHATAKAGIELTNIMQFDRETVLAAAEEFEAILIDIYGSKGKVDAG